MTLEQALGVIQQRKEADRRREIFLVCQFQPLHLGTFLQGHFALRFPGEAADIKTGLYGDLQGTLVVAAKSQADAAAVVIEWADLDPRLGLRSTGGWGHSRHADIVENCRQQFGRILGGLEAIAARMPVALVPPTLPISLLGHTTGWQLDLTEAELHKEAAEFLMEAARIGGVTVLNSANLARISPDSSRSDVLMELRAGFPYSTTHASALASQVIKLLFPPSPMKGLITDLDDTLWSGIAGEAGVEGISWSLAEHTHIHGLYQQMLGHLSEMGVLLAIASKNERDVAEKALRRDDLLIPAKSFFPVCVNWGPKSSSIAEILSTWNIGTESAVFVDDSAMELGEVQKAFPAMTCLQFSKKQPAKVVALLEQLRDLFGKPAIRREDALRQTSIRANAAVQAEAGAAASDEFVRDLQGRLTFDCGKDPSNRRLLELINKTNQFNLNGIRLSESEWLKLLEERDCLVLGVSYEEKFGPLGTIGVLTGRQANDHFEMTSWVLSCRAFSRKIEHSMLKYLFDHLRVDSIRLAFHRTDRNQPLRNFLASLGLDAEEDTGMLLSRREFENHIKDLPHEVRLQDHD